MFDDARVSESPAPFEVAFLRALALVPAGTLIFFYAYMAMLRLNYGRWPGAHADGVGFRKAHLVPDMVLGLLVCLSAISIVPALVALVLNLSRRWPPPLWRTTALAVASWLVLVLLVWLDPGGLFDWFLD